MMHRSQAISTFRYFSHNRSHRYGFNGMEKLDEIAEVTGSHLDFGARIYDSRLGRWLSIDSLDVKYPMMSPYVGMANNPVVFIDKDGQEFVVATFDDADDFSSLVNVVSDKQLLVRWENETVDLVNGGVKTYQRLIVEKTDPNAKLSEESQRIYDLAKSKNKHLFTVDNKGIGSSKVNPKTGGLWDIGEKGRGSEFIFVKNSKGAPKTDGTGTTQKNNGATANHEWGHEWNIYKGEEDSSDSDVYDTDAVLDA
jgi:RHS repeat-associated protein